MSLREKSQDSSSGRTNDPYRSNRTPQHEEIARRAYEIFLRRGGEHGRDREDWTQAEAELRGQVSSINRY